MAKKRSKKALTAGGRAVSGNGSNGSNGANVMSGLSGQPTGRYLVTIKEGAEKAGLQAVQSTLGARSVAVTSDYKEGLALDEISRADAALLSEVGVLVVSGSVAADLEAMAALEGSNAIEAVEPEFYIEAIQLEHETPPEEYVRGFRDSAAALYRGLYGHGEAEIGTETLAVFTDTPAFTWGLQATAVTRTRFTGRGIRVAVLDTGLDLNHPDFRGRSITPAGR